MAPVELLTPAELENRHPQLVTIYTHGNVSYQVSLTPKSAKRLMRGLSEMKDFSKVKRRLTRALVELDAVSDELEGTGLLKQGEAVDYAATTLISLLEAVAVHTQQRSSFLLELRPRLRILSGARSLVNQDFVLLCAFDR